MDLSTLPLTPLISLIAGVVILIMPRLLNYIVAIYLIVGDCSGCSPSWLPDDASPSAPGVGPALLVGTIVL